MLFPLLDITSLESLSKVFSLKSQFEIRVTRSDYFFSLRNTFIYMVIPFIMLSIILALNISLLHKNDAYSSRSAKGQREQKL